MKRAVVMLGVVMLGLVLTVACGGNSPTAATPQLPNVSGTWTGNMESSNFSAVSVQFNLSQTNDAVSGNWNAPNDWNGVVTGTVSATSFSGSVTLSAPNALGLGQRCTGTSSLTAGNVGPAASTLTLTGSGFTGSCAGMPQNIRLVIQKR